VRQTLTVSPATTRRRLVCVEALLATRLVAAPEVDVEDPQELLARRERDDLA
jgi:hypothetical protein